MGAVQEIQEVDLSVKMLRYLEEKLYVFKENKNIGFNRKQQLNDLLDSIQSYFNLRKYVEPNLETVVVESISSILAKSEVNVSKLSHRLANFLTYFSEFLVISDTMQENRRIINYYLEDMKKVAQIISEIIDSINLEIARIEYTYKVTGDYGLLNAYHSMKAQMN